MHVGSQSLSPLRQHDPAGDSVFPKEEASIVFPSFFWYGTSFEHMFPQHVLTIFVVAKVTRKPRDCC